MIILKGDITGTELTIKPLIKIHPQLQFLKNLQIFPVYYLTLTHQCGLPVT